MADWKEHHIFDIRKAAERMANAARTRTRDGEPAFESWEILELLDSSDTLYAVAESIEKEIERDGQ